MIRGPGWEVKESARNDSILPETLAAIESAILRADGGTVFVCTSDQLFDHASDIVSRLNEEGRLRRLLDALMIAVSVDHHQPTLTPKEFAGIRAKVVGALVRRMNDRRSTIVAEAA